jgi:hypothetical protein
MLSLDARRYIYPGNSGQRPARTPGRNALSACELMCYLNFRVFCVIFS